MRVFLKVAIGLLINYARNALYSLHQPDLLWRIVQPSELLFSQFKFKRTEVGYFD
jgi:hypothetical protein